MAELSTVGIVTVVLLSVLLIPVYFLIQAGILRAVALSLADVEIGWGMALFTVLLGGIAQSCGMGLLMGVDAGLVGTLVGILIWAAVISLLNTVPFRRALVVALVMAVLVWVLNVAVALVLILLGVSALGFGALGL